MAHLSRFGIGNFRAFQDLYHFQFKPITILTGTNSSGKSSLIKALLLLSKSNNFLDGLEFQSFLNLGNFDTVKNKWSGSNTITIELPFIFPSTTAELTLRLEYKQTPSAIKNATLSSLKLLDTETNEVFIHFSQSQNEYEVYDELKINFSGLWKIFIEWSNKKSINPEIRLDNLKPFKGNLGQITDSIEANKVDSFKQKPTYYNEAHLNSTLKNKAFLNYLFLHEPTWIAENIPTLFKSKTQDEIFNLLGELTELRERFNQLALEENLTLSEYILKKELEFLDKKKPSSDEMRYTYPDYFGNQSSDSLWRMLEELSGNQFRSLAFVLKEERNNIFGTEIREEFILSNKIYNQIQESVTISNSEIFLKRLLKEGFEKMIGKHKKILNEIYYVSSIRTKVDRLYRLNKGESELNDLLYEFHSTAISKEAHEFLDKYVKHFGIADGITIKVVGESYATSIQLHKGASVTSLSDLGYGISQLMPILLRIAIIISTKEVVDTSGYSPSILIIEEPETNLHPQLQSKLADLFVECYTKYNVQLIIETHSEYLIRKLQYLTAKKEITPDLTQIYYFNNPDILAAGEKQVKKINIERDGSLSDEFGKGFLDEADNIAIDLYNLNKRSN